MNPRRAFTIMEVLVSLTIFALAAIVLGAAYINVLTGYEHAERATELDANVQFAREILFREPDLEKVEEGGEFETADGGEVLWRAIVEPTDLPDLFDVTFEVMVRGGRDGRERLTQERFRMLRPTWSEDDEREKLRQEAQERITEYLRDREARL
jgi:general secretion pathway protein I